MKKMNYSEFIASEKEVIDKATYLSCFIECGEITICVMSGFPGKLYENESGLTIEFDADNTFTICQDAEIEVNEPSCDDWDCWDREYQVFYKDLVISIALDLPDDK